MTSTRNAGIATLIAGVLGALVPLAVALMPPTGDPEQYSYPSAPGGFVALQSFLAVQHLVLAWGLLAVRWSGGASGRLGTVGSWGAAIAMVALGAVEAIAATASTATSESPIVAFLDTAYGVVTIPLGVFLILLGASVIRTRAWTGWRRWVVLIAGIWVFVPLTPALIVDFTIARVALILWMVLFSGIGIALMRAAKG